MLMLTEACDDVREAGADDAVDGVRPDLVARPASTVETSEVLRAAAAQNLSVVMRGRGTKLSWGRPPARADVLVDLSRLDRVLDHAAGDLVVVVEAGATLASVQQTVGAAGQRLGIDETVPGASVGGTVATATSGPLRLLTGTVRDLLIGVTVVRADGVVATAGGRVVKNVAGYDLGKLVTGSFGTLAAVTETVFRLHPLPAAREVISAPVPDAATADRLARAVRQAQVVPSSVDLDWPATGTGTLSVVIEGIAEGVAGRAAATRELLGSAAAEEIPAGYPWAGDDTACKLTFAHSGLPAVLTVLRSLDAPVHVRGSVGAGVLYAAIGSIGPAAVAEAVSRLRAACGMYGGSVVVVDAPPAVKLAVDVWGPVPALALMRRVKDQFDPDHRLAPGRFVGGI